MEKTSCAECRWTRPRRPPPASTGQDLLLLREDLQDEVRREPESSRQILTTTHQHPDRPRASSIPCAG